MSNHKSTQDLIGQIERKDRRFRVAQTVFMLATLIALVIVINAQQHTIDGIKHQLVEQKRIAASADKRSNEQQHTILRRLDCFAVFFNQKDRTNLSISDIDKCTLDRAGDIQQFFTQKPGQSPETTQTEQPPNLTPSGSQPTGTTADPGQQPTDTRSNLEKITDSVTDTTCKLPLVGRLCN